MKALRYFRLGALLWGSALLAAGAGAQLVVEINGGASAGWRIAVVPMDWQAGNAAAVDLAQVIESDLVRYGGFEPVARDDMLSLPRAPADVVRWDWLAAGVDFVLLGSVSDLADTAEIAGKIQINWYLYDVARGRMVQSGVQPDAGLSLRRAAHRVSDQVHYYVLGVPGVSSSRLAYVATSKPSWGNRIYRLVLADADGMNEQVLFSSNEPIFAPSWSPDGRRIAFATRRNSWTQIHILDIATGRLDVLGPWGGNASEPDFSPRGDYLALTLSRNINPDIYIYHLSGGRLTRMTEHFAIDAEPDWAPDGSALVFTSDRSGLPQLYRLDLLSGEERRLTFSQSHDGGGHFLPDKNRLVFVRNRGGKSQLALLNVGSLAVQDLTEPGIYDAPTISPDGRIVLYLAQLENSQVFQGLRLAGRTAPYVAGEFELSVSGLAVRAPVWSPLYR